MGYPEVNAEQILDALKFISHTHRRLHDQRRKSETQAFFTTLTLFFVLAAARFTPNVSFPNPLPALILWAIRGGIAIVAMVAIFYLLGIHAANEINKKFAEVAEERIRAILGGNGIALADPPGVGKLHAITRIWQPVMIIVFAAIAGCVLTYRQ